MSDGGANFQTPMLGRPSTRPVSLHYLIAAMVYMTIGVGLHFLFYGNAFAFIFMLTWPLFVIWWFLKYAVIALVVCGALGWLIYYGLSRRHA